MATHDRNENKRLKQELRQSKRSLTPSAPSVPGSTSKQQQRASAAIVKDPELADEVGRLRRLEDDILALKSRIAARPVEKSKGKVGRKNQNKSMREPEHKKECEKPTSSRNVQRVAKKKHTVKNGLGTHKSAAKNPKAKEKTISYQVRPATESGSLSPIAALNKYLLRRARATQREGRLRHPCELCEKLLHRGLSTRDCPVHSGN